MALFLLVAHFIVKLIPFYARECGPATGGDRFETIDGLRGYLALGVFFGHAVLKYYWYETGRWGGQPTGIYGISSHMGVSLFFAITGFLFWGKVLRTNGRMNWKTLYVSRFLRLTPLYLFSVALVFAIVAVQTGFEMHVGRKRLLIQTASWLTFSLVEPMDINGLKGTERINAGVLWTLAYEWKFYLALPLLALFAWGWRFSILAITFVGLFLLAPSERIVFNFFIGMLVAYAVGQGRWGEALKSRTATVVALGCLTALLLPLEPLGSARGWLEPLLLFVVFLIIAHGNGLFGLLTHPAAKYLGTVSYGIYLLHGIALYVMLQLLNSVKPIISMQPLEYWMMIALIGVIIVLVCGVTYRFVEHPFLVRKPEGEANPNRILEPPVAMQEKML
jgi:peptidoglycan/LPS O-acetylase OafA/YrhL